MGLKRIIAITLVVSGIVVLAYSGITFRTPGKPVDLGPIHIATTHRHFVPPLAGAIALACGVVLLFVGGKRS